ncbi:MAG: hypothetical protein J5818_00240 [Eggerthellaceae bacterium]|nr:hypothetical protein [Eggerthellaceae bacterium]
MDFQERCVFDVFLQSPFNTWNMIVDAAGLNDSIDKIVALGGCLIAVDVSEVSERIFA